MLSASHRILTAPAKTGITISQVTGTQYYTCISLLAHLVTGKKTSRVGVTDLEDIAGKLVARLTHGTPVLHCRALDVVNHDIPLAPTCVLSGPPVAWLCLKWRQAAGQLPLMIHDLT